MDFEKNWRKKLEKGLLKKGIPMDDLEAFRSPHNDSLAWSREFMDEAAKHLDEDGIKEVMTGCSCLYPKEKLLELKKIYDKTGDLDAVHRLLQKKFEKEIAVSKGLNREELEYIMDKGMGMAGIRDGSVIFATKIPADVHAYLAADNAAEKAAAYCHCPRIRNVFGEKASLDHRYCYCGAGYYKDLWETLTGKPVEVEIVRSLLKGDPVCSFRIRL